MILIFVNWFKAFTSLDWNAPIIYFPSLEQLSWAHSNFIHDVLLMSKDVLLIVSAGLRCLKSMVFWFHATRSENVLREGRIQRVLHLLEPEELFFFALWASPERHMPKSCWELWSWGHKFWSQAHPCHHLAAPWAGHSFAVTCDFHIYKSRCTRVFETMNVNMLGTLKFSISKAFLLEWTIASTQDCFRTQKFCLSMRGLKP